MTSLFRIARKSLLLWFGAAFLAGGLAVLFMGIDGVIQERRYQNDSRVAQAVVLAKSIKPASRQESSSTRYEITYRFATADGRTVEGTDAVSVETWESLDAGSSLSITYLPDQPHVNRAALSGRMDTALVAIGLGSIFALVGGFFFFRTAIRVWRQWSILRGGDAAQGTIIAIEPTSTEINNVRQWEIRYRYRDHHGLTHEGTSGDMAPDEAHPFAIGETVKVRFDREHPDESVLDRPDASAAMPETVNRSTAGNEPSFWKRLVDWATMLAFVFGVIVGGEILIPITGLDRFITVHKGVLTAITIGMTALAFALFMGGILYRIFGGAGRPMSHADIEDLARSTRITRGKPYFRRVSTYRLKGWSAGSAFHDEFSFKEAKEAWNRRAWRESSRWRGNFVIIAGGLLLAVGLFSIFVVIGPNGIKFLCGAAIIYLTVRTFIAFARA
jgi:hypothetical protein